MIMDIVLEKLEYDLTVCKLKSLAEVSGLPDLFFIAKTDEEVSLVCRTEDAPAETTEREDGWKAFRVKGQLDFSLTGILAKIAGVLAAREISIFAVSTYNTDYVLVKAGQFGAALEALSDAGYRID